MGDGRPSLFVTSNTIFLCGGLFGELYQRLYNKVLPSRWAMGMEVTGLAKNEHTSGRW
jgi:hypothetical protein